MGNLQAIPAIKCENRMKDPSSGKSSSQLSNRCEGLNPNNVYKTLYPQYASPLSQFNVNENKEPTFSPINHPPLPATSVEDCAEQCIKAGRGKCQTFQYDQTKNTCDMYNTQSLSSTTKDTTSYTIKDVSSLDKDRMPIPTWIRGYYQNYPKEGKPGDYICQYSAVDQSCNQIKQVTCPKKGDQQNPGFSPDPSINRSSSFSDTYTEEDFTEDSNKTPKIRINHVGFTRCQLGADDHCIDDIYTVNAFGFPTANTLPNPPIDQTLYSKPYNVLNGKFATACPVYTKFEEIGKAIGCIGSGDTTCFPTYYPFSTPEYTPVTKKCDPSIAEEVYLFKKTGETDPSFNADEATCAKECRKYGLACKGYASYVDGNDNKCVLYKQSKKQLNNSIYIPDGNVKSVFKNPNPYPRELNPDTQPVETQYTDLDGPLLYCPQLGTITINVNYDDNVAKCNIGDGFFCGPRVDPYSTGERIKVCGNYTKKDNKNFFANSNEEFWVESENACQDVCDTNSKCTGYSVRNAGGEYYCTPYSVPQDKMSSFTLPPINGVVAKMKTVGACPGSLVRDKGGNCVMKFDNRHLGAPTAGYMTGRPLGAGIKRDPVPNPNSGTAFETI